MIGRWIENPRLHNVDAGLIQRHRETARRGWVDRAQHGRAAIVHTCRARLLPSVIVGSAVERSIAFRPISPQFKQLVTAAAGGVGHVEGERHGLDWTVGGYGGQIAPLQNGEGVFSRRAVIAAYRQQFGTTEVCRGGHLLKQRVLGLVVGRRRHNPLLEFGHGRDVRRKVAGVIIDRCVGSVFALAQGEIAGALGVERKPLAFGHFLVGQQFRDDSDQGLGQADSERTMKQGDLVVVLEDDLSAGRRHVASDDAAVAAVARRLIAPQHVADVLKFGR